MAVDVGALKVLVTGGVRSGKSRHAERLLTSYDAVTYVAPGPSADEDSDPDWAARIRAHKERRPASWTTLETRALDAALGTPGPLLVDCLGTWLSAVLDGRWEEPADVANALVHGHLEAAVTALVAHPGPVVLVTNEVGLGVVPSHRSGRLFRDLLGTVNQRFGEACDEVHLVVAGRVLTI